MTATTAFGGFLTRVRHTLTADDRTDAELVDEFARSRSDAAFAELVRRFAPMVWGVCRRTVGHHHLAEDAFQAVFLVLARKSSAIRPPSAVGGWLHAVAVHTSLRARTMADRRRHAPLDTERAAEFTEASDSDTLRVLDEEIARLPDRLRVAVVLCELDGLSRKEAATRLGVAEGTLSSRLAAARKQLAARLRSRGVALGVGGLAALLAGSPASAAPPAVATASNTASALAEGAIRTMFLSKIKLLTVGAMMTLALAAVGISVTPPVSASDRHQVRRNAPTPKAAGKEGKILLWVDEKPQLLKPDGTELESPDEISKAWLGVGWGNAKLSPDGKRVAYAKQGDAAKLPVPAAPRPGVAVSRNRTVLQILELEGKKETQTLAGFHLNSFHWVDGGKKLYVYGQEIEEDGSVSGTVGAWVYDPATDKRTPLKVPEDFVVRGMNADGKTAVVDEWKMSATTWHQRAHLWTVGSDKPTPLLELNHSFNNKAPQFSPDGKRLLCQVRHYGQYKSNGDGSWTLDGFQFDNLVVIDLATKKQTVVKKMGEEPEWHMAGFAWSPDGKKVAYVENKRLPRVPGGPRTNDPFRVVVCDPDGQNEKVIAKAEGSWLVGFDWK